MVKASSIYLARFQVWLVQLSPTQGHEMNKTRQCVIISPDEMLSLGTVIVAPMTTKGFAYPSRVCCTFQGKKGLILLDQMRTVDKTRLVKHLGSLHQAIKVQICDKLQEMFTL